MEEKQRLFDKMNITELEREVEDKLRESREFQFQMMEILIYLKTSGRYKENKRYENESFYTYIDDRFNIRKGTYMENQRAFTRYPEETKEYGVGLVAKVLRVCGTTRAKMALEKIEEARDTAKNELKRGKIEAIIDKYRVVPKEKKEKVDWKARYEHECRTHEETKNKLRVAMAKIKEQAEQIDRLKATAKKITDIKSIIGQGEQRRAAQL